MVKMTFSLDDTTAERLRRSAARLARPQSQVVREAIREYSERVGRLSDEERARLLSVFDRLLPTIPSRPASEVDAEIRQLRQARKRGGRRHRPKGE